MPPIVNDQAPVPPPAYHRAQARLGASLHIDALTLVTTLPLLALCRLAIGAAPLSAAITCQSRRGPAQL